MSQVNYNISIIMVIFPQIYYYNLPRFIDGDFFLGTKHVDSPIGSRPNCRNFDIFDRPAGMAHKPSSVCVFSH